MKAYLLLHRHSLQRLEGLEYDMELKYVKRKG